ncbi:Spo0B domain-containing protein [Desulfosporosinus sp. PR]|uniref:Spo0B domain-containing protein n=1 Tax=Candidatus Desulfosporosinus nitrosoreducens TaxID=3401928 RepID=UPI00280000F5|nr:Spo0B domain-containing protein [Desulfosporosinus sp. PR]MDQ7096321.1 Spo0B domain-containing protein [Desulfosporosinus sp. PR]
MSDLEHNLLADMLQWYRLQRHDFLNHWQVVMGNLQLQQPEKAFAYMRELIRPHEEQKISQIPVPVLSALLLGWVIRLGQMDVVTTLDYPEEMKLEDFWRDHWRGEYGEGLSGYTRECLKLSEGYKGFSDLSSEVYLFDEPEGFSCQFILENEEKVLIDKTVRFTRELSE